MSIETDRFDRNQAKKFVRGPEEHEITRIPTHTVGRFQRAYRQTGMCEPLLKAPRDYASMKKPPRHHCRGGLR